VESRMGFQCFPEGNFLMALTISCREICV